MAKRIKTRKRKHYANRTFGGGNTKNRRGKGNKGGVGNAGARKHHWLRTIKTVGTNKKNKGLSGFNNPNAKNLKEISLKQLDCLLEKGVLKPENNELTLKKTKVLSNGTLKHKLKVIKATSFTKKTIEKLNALGITTEQTS
ncbi:MAG: uL15m family ribosomal protein [Candidatus Micrarchaeota archaeon]